MTRNILLTGKSGVGKTTAIKTIVENLSSDLVAGFWSKEMRERGKRVGFAIETLSGKKGILAHVDFTAGPRVSKYRVSIQDIDSVIIPELRIARDSDCIIIIDEIAKMELFSKLFAPEVIKCLDTERVIGTIQKRGSSFLEEVKQRVDVQLLELTLENRDEIPQHVLSLLK